MCGIVAISSSKSERFNLKQSLEAIKHRGPDDLGTYCSDEGDGQLGQVRLSIIDLTSAGHQPMVDSSGRFIIVYNGEIYNFKILKKNLEIKYGKINWKSTTDTEVILEGFAREGPEFLSKMNGIFALVIYDKKEKSFHVLRDPIGIKPLYYTNQKGAVFFGSELKALLAFRHLSRTLRMQSLLDQLLFMYVPEPYTMYQEFFKIDPGMYYVFRKGKNILKTKLFSKLEDPIIFSREADMIDCFRDTFSSAVSSQLISDVPISLLLSGGLDSSSIAYEAVKSGGNIKSAYTISFSKEDSHYDKQSDDLFYAKKIAKKLNLNLQVIKAESELLSLLPEMIPFLEDGISDPAAINTFLICESARKDGVKVMLSGQGADEYLCGYRRYHAEKIIQSMSFISKKALSFADSIFPSLISGPLNAFSRRLKRLAFASKQQKIDRLPGYFMWNNPSDIYNLFLDKLSISLDNDIHKFFKNNKNNNTLDAMLKADQKFDLLSLNLAYSDKMSMMVGVEARVPFLDFEMVRLMNSIPINMKLRGNEKKYILKKAMEPYLPREIIYRQKAGFALPIRSWFKEKNEIINKYFDNDRIKRQEIFDPILINKILNDQFSGKTDNSYTIYAMLCQQIWLDKEYGI